MKPAAFSITRFPECYLMLVVFLSGYKPPFELSPLNALALGVVMLQLVFQHRISGVIIGCLFLLGNQLLLVAVIAEFNQFPDADAKSVQGLIAGLALVAVNTAVAGWMIVRYSGLRRHAVA